MTNEERICMLVQENGGISLEDLSVQMGEAELIVKVNPQFRENVFRLIRAGKLRLGLGEKLTIRE